MIQSKHIFIQVDTDKVSTVNFDKGKVTTADVMRSSLIFDQGSMSMGNPIKNFQIEIEKDQDVYFTVLPFYLFSRNKLYFTGFSNKEKVSIPIVPIISQKTPQLSFLLETSKVNITEALHFNLEMQMEYLNEEGKIEKISFGIDPVLKIKQR